jgi:hypothetical protein
MNTTKSGSSVKWVLCGFMLALCLAGIGAGTVEAAGDKLLTVKAPKSSCSKACRNIKVTQGDGTTVGCSSGGQGTSGCLCKCGDTVVVTPPK